MACGLLTGSSLISAAVAADAGTLRCDPMLADRQAVLDKSLAMHGNAPVEQSLQLPPLTPVIIFAREHGTDVILELVDSGGHTVARADNPVHRSGIQRIAINTDASGRYSARLVQKESDGSDNTTQLRAVALGSIPAADACAEIHRLFAKADAAVAGGDTPAQATTGSAQEPTAADIYQRVAARLAAAGSSELLAEAQHATAALLNDDLEDWVHAEMWAASAVQTYTALRDEYGAARARTVRGAALMDLAVSPASQSAKDDSAASKDKLARARALLREAAAFHAAHHQTYDEAVALNYIGVAYYYEGADESAIRAYDHALQRYIVLRNRLRQAQTLQNIANCERELGRLKEAIAHYGQVLQLINRTDAPRAFAHVLNNSAWAQWIDGNIDGALDQYGQALALREHQNPIDAAQTLHGIGSVYETIGDRALALDFYGQALTLRSASVDGPGRTLTLRAIGNILLEQGRADQALSMHQEALGLVSNPYTLAKIRIQIAQDLNALGRPQEARKALEPVLQHTEPGYQLDRALALRELSHAHLIEHDTVAATADLVAAVKAFGRIGAPADEFASWVDLAQLRHQSGADKEAFRALDKALALAEEVRVQSANPELRATLMQPMRRAFDLKISMLVERPTDTRENSSDAVAHEALQTAEQARMRALNDFRSVDSTGVPADVIATRQRLYSQLAARQFQLESQLDQNGADDPHVVAIRSEIALLRQRVDQIDTRIAAASIRSHATADTATSAAIDQSAVPVDTAIVEYWLGSGHAIAWVATREHLTMVPLGNSAQINEAARNFHAQLRGFGSVPASARLEASQKLSELIMRPLQPAIGRRRTLIFAPDGALHYVPFAALQDSGGSGGYLIERHDIAVTASLRDLLRNDSGAPTVAAKQLLLVADPVYSATDARLASNTAASSRSASAPWQALWRGGHSEASLPRLPGTRQEAAKIASLFQTQSVDRLEGFAATRDAFLGAHLEGYRFIHVASHAIADAEIPQLSALVLSTVDRTGRQISGHVLAADLMGKRLSAEAVVLSACDTAMGKEIAGEGLMGLRYVVLARGARSVIASLWEVPDRAASSWMSTFYSSLLRDHRSVVQASSIALRDMLRGEFKDPGVWAAFGATVRNLTDAP
jgi:CHAT domain-containing protein/tetratricopeptide (TPR) repeat protein